MKNKPDRVIKIHPEYHLIVTEGTDTEPAYFGTIKEIINKQYPDKIQLNVFGEGDNTISLFERAKVLAGNNSNIYKHVWILYDTDDFPAAHIDRVLQLCADNSTEETKKSRGRKARRVQISHNLLGSHAAGLQGVPKQAKTCQKVTRPEGKACSNKP